ncbi:uncharacterized protein LOC129541418 [Moschus berezovskii]|uniref:uncharacterized protein LOC129541418 n=1 Tax=Moschus berezovskii TaxID=68408 RepID=UPI002444244F|nr:uncharacterized protein LOC129541418 [Moschus berezovskii]
MEDQGPVQAIKMVLSRLIQETVLHTQEPNKRHTVNLSTEGQETLGKDREGTVSRQGTAPDTLEINMDKPLLYPEEVDTGNPVLVRPVTVKDIQKTQVDSPEQLMEGLVPAQETKMDLPRARKERVLGTQSPNKGGTVILSIKGLDQAQGKDRGTTMSNQETAPDTLELLMDKPLLDPEVVGIGNPVLVRPVTVKDIQKTQVDSPGQLMEELVRTQETNMDLPRARQETVLGTQSLIKGGTVILFKEGQDLALGKDRGATMSSQGTAPDTLELDMNITQPNLEVADIGNPVLVRPVTVKGIQKTQVDSQGQLMKGLVRTQETNMDLPRARQETVLGTQSLIKGGTMILFKEGQDLALGKDREDTMSSLETAPDTLELDLHKPPLDPEAVDTGNPVLVRTVTAQDIQKTQVDSPGQHMEGLVPAQETNMDLPRARQETVLGTQSPIKRGTGILSTKGLDQAQGKDWAGTMSNQETAPDTLELDMDKTPLDPEAVDTGNPVLVKPVTEKTQVDSQGQLMEGLIRTQETNMDLPRARQETVLGTQSLIKGGTVILFKEGQDLALGKDREATMSSLETAPDTLELDMDKPPLDPEAVDTGNPVLVKPVTVKDIQKTQVDSLGLLMEGLVPAQETNRDIPIARQETVLGTQSPIKGGTVILSTKGLDQARGKDRGGTMSSQKTAPDTLELDLHKPPLDPEAVGTVNPVIVRTVTVQDIQKCQVDSLGQHMEGLVPAQETNMDLPRARQETVLGTQSPIKGGTVILCKEGQDLALGKDRGATMSSQGTAPDSLELDMDITQLDLEAADIGNPMVASPVTERDMQEIQVDSP